MGRNNDLLMETPLPGINLFRRRQKIKKTKAFFKRQARDVGSGFKIIGKSVGGSAKRAIDARVKAEKELRMGIREREKTRKKPIKRRKESPLGFRF